MKTGLSVLLSLAAVSAVPAASASDADSIDRGRYLARITGCNDCHTPGYFMGHPEETRYLGGSDVGFAIPGLGVFVGPNLTPDKATGIGTWTEAQIVTAITKGERPDGRILAPIMPWRALAHLTHADVEAIAAYLKTIPPVTHKVPGPFGPNDKPDVFVMVLVPPDAYVGLPKPK